MGTVPRHRHLYVGAIFEVGIYDYDKQMVVMPMKDAQDLLMMGDQVGDVEIQTSNPDKVQEILAPSAGRSWPRRDHRLAADELGAVPGA